MILIGLKYHWIHQRKRILLVTPFGSLWLCEHCACNCNALLQTGYRAASLAYCDTCLLKAVTQTQIKQPSAFWIQKKQKTEQTLSHNFRFTELNISFVCNARNTDLLFLNVLMVFTQSNGRLTWLFFFFCQITVSSKQLNWVHNLPPPTHPPKKNDKV